MLVVGGGGAKGHNTNTQGHQLCSRTQARCTNLLHELTHTNSLQELTSSLHELRGKSGLPTDRTHAHGDTWTDCMNRQIHVSWSVREPCVLSVGKSVREPCVQLTGRQFVSHASCQLVGHERCFPVIDMNCDVSINTETSLAARTDRLGDNKNGVGGSP